MECILINTAGCSEILWFESIIYCSAEGSYTRIHLSDKRSVLSSKNLVWFEENLHSNHFIRLHRSFIINLKFVSRIYKNESKVCLRNGIKIPISKSRTKQFWKSVGLIGSM